MRFVIALLSISLYFLSFFKINKSASYQKLTHDRRICMIHHNFICTTINNVLQCCWQPPFIRRKPCHNVKNVSYSLAVVENLWGKSKGEFVYSFSESVHPIVPQKKNPHELGLGNFFTAL